MWNPSLFDPLRPLHLYTKMTRTHLPLNGYGFCYYYHWLLWMHCDPFSHRHPHPTAVNLTCMSYKTYIIQNGCSTCPRRVYLCKRYWIFIARLKRGTRCIQHYFDFDVCCHQHAPKLHYFVLFKWVFHIFKRTLVDTKLWVELTANIADRFYYNNRRIKTTLEDFSLKISIDISKLRVSMFATTLLTCRNNYLINLYADWAKVYYMEYTLKQRNLEYSHPSR